MTTEYKLQTVRAAFENAGGFAPGRILGIKEIGGDAFIFCVDGGTAVSVVQLFDTNRLDIETAGLYANWLIMVGEAPRASRFAVRSQARRQQSISCKFAATSPARNGERLQPESIRQAIEKAGGFAPGNILAFQEICGDGFIFCRSSKVAFEVAAAFDDGLIPADVRSAFPVWVIMIGAGRDCTAFTSRKR